jgi:hypothetical protein
VIDLRLECPNCKQPMHVSDLSKPQTVACDCGWNEEVEAVEGMVERCPVCKTDDLYIQKDFPERVGVLLVFLGLSGATIAWAYDSWFWTFGILFGSFAIDWALFYSRKDVTVCYRCLAQFRNMPHNPKNQPFDLAIGEKYRQERIRKEQMQD